MPAISSLADDKRYYVTVSGPVQVMTKLVWRPGMTIQSQGSLIKQLAAKPENDGLIEVTNEVPEEEVI